jgi:hypothetical protein
MCHLVRHVMAGLVTWACLSCARGVWLAYLDDALRTLRGRWLGLCLADAMDGFGSVHRCRGRGLMVVAEMNLRV